MAEPQRNVVLEARMRVVPITAGELAEQMNQVLLMRTGRMGELTDRTVRRFLSGQTRWPQARQRLALQQVFGCTAEHLGFIKPGASSQEDPVHRRAFLTTAAGVVASPVFPAPTGRVGVREIRSLREALDSLIEKDDQTGGHTSLEATALQQGQLAVDFVQQAHLPSDALRRRTYSLASEAVVTAAWSAIETGGYERAQQQLERALALAGYSADPAAELLVWNTLALLAQRRERFTDAAAAAEAARATGAARRDPLFASLAHARAAVAHSAAQDKRRALRSLDYAQTALAKAPDAERPEWVHFYDGAELDGLSALTSLQLGRFADAEYHAHRTLARIRPGLTRNHAYYTVILGLSQIRQGELERACATVDPLFTRSLPSSERIRQMLAEFRRHASETGSITARRWLNDTRRIS